MPRFIARWGYITALLFAGLPQVLAGAAGAKSPMAKEALLATLQTGKAVEGQTIRGEDLVDLIAAYPELAIRIADAVIEGGLDFTRLPAVSMDEIDFPEGWQESQRRSWRERLRAEDIQRVRRVNSPIVIANSEFRPDTVHHNEASDLVLKAVGVLFSQESRFDKVRFAGPVDLSGVAYVKGVDFNRSTFQGVADLTNATFWGASSFTKTEFHDIANFFQSSFEGAVDFSRVTFAQDAYFSRARFTGGAEFSRASFQGEAIFMNAQFDTHVGFVAAQFDKLAFFRGSVFQKTLDLSQALFQANADLRDTRIAELNLNNEVSPVVLDSQFDFRAARIGQAHFQDITFLKEVDFSDAHFEGETIFRYVSFRANCYFLRSLFSGKLTLERVNFMGETDFTDAQFPHGRGQFFLSYVDLAAPRLHWPQLPDPAQWSRAPEMEPISRVLEKLATSFQTHNALADANEAYYHMKLAELAESRAGQSFWERLPTEAEWLFWGVPSGYGTRARRILLGALGVQLAFTLVYFFWGDIRRQPSPERERDFEFRLRLLELPEAYLTRRGSHKALAFAPLQRLIDAWRLSWVILFKLGHRDATVSGKWLGLDLRYVVWLEWALGYGLIVTLIATLKNTQPFLNKLLSGVF